MKKFIIDISHRAYRNGHYEIEAPDEDAARTLAADIPFSDKRIVWEEYVPNMDSYPREDDIFVEEVK